MLPFLSDIHNYNDSHPMTEQDQLTQNNPGQLAGRQVVVRIPYIETNCQVFGQRNFSSQEDQIVSQASYKRWTWEETEVLMKSVMTRKNPQNETKWKKVLKDVEKVRGKSTIEAMKSQYKYARKNPLYASLFSTIFSSQTSTSESSPETLSSQTDLDEEVSLPQDDLENFSPSGPTIHQEHISDRSPNVNVIDLVDESEENAWKTLFKQKLEQVQNEADLILDLRKYLEGKSASAKRKNAIPKSLDSSFICKRMFSNRNNQIIDQDFDWNDDKIIALILSMRRHKRSESMRSQFDWDKILKDMQLHFPSISRKKVQDKYWHFIHTNLKLLKAINS